MPEHFYCVTYLLRRTGVIPVFSTPIGPVFIEPAGFETEQERSILEQLSNESLHSVSLEMCPRVRVIVGSVDVADACRRGEAAILRALDVINVETRLSEHVLLDVGYCTHLASGIVEPIVRRSPGGSPMFLLDRLRTHHLLQMGEILRGGIEEQTALMLALFDALAWHRRARGTEDAFQHYLGQWIACEMLTRVDEQETITVKFCFLLGFFPGRYGVEGIASASAPQYNAELRFLNERLDTMRRMRNEIAHSGLRRIPLSAERRAEFLMQLEILNISCEAALSFARVGIRDVSCATVEELWSRWREVYQAWVGAGEAIDWRESIASVRHIQSLAIAGVELTHLHF